MNNLTEEACKKISERMDSIIELYDQRKSQKEIAEKFHISVAQVAKITQSKGIWHTVKSKPIEAIQFYSDFSYLLNAYET